jgi:hypothetical protein
MRNFLSGAGANSTHEDAGRDQDKGEDRSAVVFENPFH